MTTTTKRGNGWKPGQSGNPRGRAPGTGRITKLRQEIADHMPQVIEVLLRAALSGDVQAARCLLDRSIATLRPIEPPTPFALAGGDDLTMQGRAVVAAVATGQLSTAQAAQLVAAINSLAGLREADENVRAIEKIRGQLEKLTTQT